jgi:hypothetical protein
MPDNYPPHCAQLNGFSSISHLAGNSASIVGIYGSFATGTAPPAACGLLFCAVFNLALYRVHESESPPRYQVLLILSLLVISFMLHMVYLPAGLCCFIALVLCQNELLLPTDKNYVGPAEAQRRRAATKLPQKQQ